ncbi:zinc-dependent metalloprotease [Sphingomonas sp. 8AM]|uniref:zinc-dependent metalloprotease n=1 Tax=Sphingomonas sp. 8AM TaxID=2653170 RepID=UPI0019154A43|nr:zinc-dependent metalloprotease [Sphingomonas sp. 8AM]
MSLLLTAGTVAVTATAQQRATVAPTLLPLAVDRESGKVLVTLPRPDDDGVSGRFLYATALKSGLGSAPIRIDHGMVGDTQLLAFRRLGKKVAVVFENPRYRSSGDAHERRGVSADFPFSTVAMLDVATTAPDGTVTVDLAPFLLRDTMRLADKLNAEAKGFKLIEALSAVDPGSVKAFPDNIEMEAVQTYASETPGKEVDTIAPDGRQVSFTVHHSLIRLPAPGFVPRRFDIRSGTFATPVYEFNTPLGAPVLQQFANHFRIEKLDPGAARSRVRKPIVFYIDNKAPEPIRTALVEGVAWWNQAFDAAGYIDAFVARVLPADADPQDVRYNVVNWNERQTRSWSYGGGVTDPRTGEIIKGNVVLEGLRLRQDIVIFESLVGTAEENKGTANDPVRVALARIRQLGAHEVGHALGFSHNFAASTQGRASVMDYPFAKIALNGDTLDLSDAYATGIGTWDKFSVDWLYGQPAAGTDPDVAAAAKADAAQRAGMRYLTDIDGRDASLAVPGDSMWTEGDDKPADLAHVMAVRRVALARFGPGVLHAGAPLADLRRSFVPLWLFHRYAVAAIGKTLGGVHYSYATTGDSAPAPTRASAAEQAGALDALFATLSPAALTVPPALALTLSSGINGNADPQYDTEVLDTAGGAVFDPLVATDVAAQVTLDTLLAPTRLTRLHLQHAADATLPGVETLLDRLVGEMVMRHDEAVSQRIALRTVLAIAAAARAPATGPDVALRLDATLQSIRERLARGKRDAWAQGVARLLGDPASLDRALTPATRTAPTIPPGMPIG